MKPNASETWNPTPVQAFHGSRKRIEFDMTPLLVPEFTLRRNTDGSIEVICLRCLLTAGNSFRETDIEAIQKRHQCDPSLMVDVMHHCSTC